MDPTRVRVQWHSTPRRYFKESPIAHVTRRRYYLSFGPTLLACTGTQVCVMHFYYLLFAARGKKTPEEQFEKHCLHNSYKYYWDYECNEPLVASSKLTATSSRVDRGPENAKLYGEWAFNVSNWVPTEEEILAASSYIQPEEKERISKFVFKNDAKSALIGRLMIRNFIKISTCISYEEITLGRDELGKPILTNSNNHNPHFNISHQGDFVVLIGDIENEVGIDIMKIEPPANKNIPEFFRLMRRQFSPKEWENIYTFHREAEQMESFYRHWCLKESYVKNIGIGLRVNLAEISFDVKTPKLKVGQIVTDTNLYVKNVLQEGWVFEETLLDEKHAIAIACHPNEKSQWFPSLYTFITFEELIKEAKPINAPDDDFKNKFMKMLIKTF
ncbi:L-aminoadipate-semialdehyde dehydrogenase-phosphopantetheinyl transferase [Eumeta japonica]|uniref:L-aminoadipate-semialdehyde dehydrogenase-phosphopantetheinyl transferase n=1 Tax=Eumeta variegata TaxID=151549 RepID=A0A4C1T5W1_EUMVA|nr:L-aminoadipate-semialdehyde dehydrogenase-phosphopantetheinyl transferase [Eumeta japonica]